MGVTVGLVGGNGKVGRSVGGLFASESVQADSRIVIRIATNIILNFTIG